MRTEPRATYRVQLRREFDFDAAAALLPYLAELGISHLYCSPYLQAAPGSAHGYDVVDPTRVNPELGGDEGLQRLDSALRRQGMGQLLDIVPNHMCVTSPENRWWWDVLRSGRDSRFARVFDIDWDAPGVEGRIVLPVLADPLDDVLRRGEMDVAVGPDGAELRYFEQRFPLRPDGPDAVFVTAELLAAQHYVLEWWRSGLRRVNYRRFFDVSGLAALRAEDPGVFAMTHERALRLVHDGVVDGVRVDHVDGLRDPAEYLRRLREAAGDAWIVVEKILALDERLPEGWPVDGTTGYETAARLLQVLLDPDGVETIVAAYPGLTGDTVGFGEQSRESRRLVLEQLLESEVSRLVRVAGAAGIADARQELIALLAAMPVYRVYPEADVPLSEAEQSLVREAAVVAAATPQCVAATIDHITRILCDGGGTGAADTEFRARFQQLSAAATAKGVEDTAFYRHVPLVALNEVGDDPGRNGITSDAFQAAAACGVLRHGLTLNATSTHDTKRGEDARIRVAMLGEMPETWLDACRTLFALGRRHRLDGNGPSPVAELLLYETLVAAHPIDAERLCAYMRKAVREAKQETSWLDQNHAYEESVDRFARAVLDDSAMLAVIETLVGTMTPAWQIASLTQTLLKLVLPGVPDIYQGSELWDLRLVDPDNRGPVDYAQRSAMLGALDGLRCDEVMQQLDTGLPKLHLLRSALSLRARRPDAFKTGAAYRGVSSAGPAADHVVAAVRGDDAVTAVGVLRPLRLGGAWRGTTIAVPQGRWRNVLDATDHAGGELSVAALLQTFPVALLERIA